jgi:hypothetical protein
MADGLAHAFQTPGDLAGGREIEAILDEEKTHRDSLQNSLNRLVVQRASSDKKTIS